ncbi:hypothetical protein ACFL6U_25885 [Planctomycetota bacterium]
MDKWQQRIQDVLGQDDARCARNSQRWRTHLRKRLSLPIRVTGIEDFPWEEPYVFGGWSNREYEELKKTRPSYTDTFELLDIGEPQEHDDLDAQIKRISDGKVFHVGLSWLRTADKGDPLYTTLNDYSVWHCNY